MTRKTKAVAAPASLPALPRHQPVIATADDLLLFIEQLRGRDRVRAVFNAGAEKGKPAVILASFVQAHAEGMHELPPEMLRVLASVAADVLAARTDRELWAAVGLQRPAKGGPGAAASMPDHFFNKVIGDALWLEHAKLTGDPVDSLPAKLAVGVYAAVAKRFPGKTHDGLAQHWQRYKAAGRRPDGGDTTAHPVTLLKGSRHRR